MNKENINKNLSSSERINQNINHEEIDENKTIEEIKDATITKQGIVADKFDQAPPINATQEELKEFEEKNGVNITYNFNADELESGLKIFQKHTIYKKNLIYTLIIGLLFITYLVRIGIGQSQGNFDIFICVICVAVLGMIWYYPLNHIKTIVKVVRENEIEDFKMTVYDNAIVFGENETATIINYDSGYLRVWEDSEKFVIGYEKQRIFLLPKRCIENQETVNKVSNLFKNGLGKKYTQL